MTRPLRVTSHFVATSFGETQRRRPMKTFHLSTVLLARTYVSCCVLSSTRRIRAGSRISRIDQSSLFCRLCGAVAKVACIRDVAFIYDRDSLQYCSTIMWTKTCLLFVGLCGVFCIISADVYLEEKFSDDTWETNWIYSEHAGKEFGKFVRTAGKFFNDDAEDQGIQTSEDARFYALSRKFKPFSTENKDFVVQFSAKHEQSIDCGGGYVKVFDCSLTQEDMHGESPYRVMFGPDICGPGTKKVHVIINYRDRNILINKDIRCKDDVYTHVYTLIIRPDNTYEVQIDGEKAEAGSLEEDWDLLATKKIKDPEAKKPSDWDDRATIADPDDTKPADWDKAEHIADADAQKPDDWDDEMDGEWEPPLVDNPEFKGEWSAKQIDNPAYKGPWTHPEVDNPEYEADAELYKHPEICAVGFDLWQVKSGTIFDNVLVTDDVEYAKSALSGLKEKQEGEKKIKEEQDKADADARAAEFDKEKANEDDEDKDDDDDDEDEDDSKAPPPVTEEHDEL